MCNIMKVKITHSFFKLRNHAECSDLNTGKCNLSFRLVLYIGISGKPLADKQLKYDEDSDGVSFKKTMGRDESPVESIRKCEIRLRT